jgi:ankyrin repeat protein
MGARLPLHPNLGFYRKSAKDLKRAVAAGDKAALERLARSHPRAGDVAAVTLKDAQLVIARELGFATWAALKAAVEEAARTPAVSPAERLLAAVKAGDEPALRELLASHPDLPLGPPLVEACDRGSLPLVTALLDGGADAREPEALFSAAHPGPHKAQPALDVIELLIARGAPDDFLTHAALGKVDELRRELPGVDVSARGRGGNTALGLAAGNGHVEAVKLLLEAGAAPSQKLLAHVFLHAWGASYREIARLFLDRGLTCSFAEACLVIHVPTVRRLLAADPGLKDRPDENGHLPMTNAFVRGEVELARVLLEAGAVDPHGQGRALVEVEPQRGKRFEHAVYRNCTFDNASFHDCSLENVVFSDVDLSGAHFRMINLTNARIDAAWINGLTIYGIEVAPLLAEERRRRAAAKK